MTNDSIVLSFSSNYRLRVCVSVAFTIGMFGQTVYVTPPDKSLTSRVAVLRHNTPEYSNALKELLPSSTADLDPILPFSIVLRNISQEPLLMTSVLFEVEDQSGTVRNYGINDLDLSPSSIAHLQPASARFVSISPVANRAVAGKRPEVVKDFTPSVEQVASDLSRNRRITVSIDGLVTASGVFLGPDRTGAFHRLQEEQRANAFIVSKLTMLQASDTAAITQELNELAAMSPGPARSPVDRDFYSIRVSRTARYLLAALNRDGPDAVRTIVSSLNRKVIVRRQ